jgi:hypothetical protein
MDQIGTLARADGRLADQDRGVPGVLTSSLRATNGRRIISLGSSDFAIEPGKRDPTHLIVQLLISA